MGAWGTALYSNDSASDIRGDYVDLLRRGKTNQEVVEILMQRNREIFDDEEEEPLFWFALADTQWNNGRLLPEVKEKALFFLEQKGELERWKESGEKKVQAWQNTLKKLKAKLLTPQPPEKRIYKYRLYKCEWNLGDIFAYQFTGEYSQEKGFYQKYIAFRKVTETSWYPGHIVPVVQFYKRIFMECPKLENLLNLPLQEVCSYSTALQYNPKLQKQYNLQMISTSKKSIPQNNLTFLGNIPGEDLMPYQENRGYIPYDAVAWKKGPYNNYLEKYIIDMYLSWKDIA